MPYFVFNYTYVRKLLLLYGFHIGIISVELILGPHSLHNKVVYYNRIYFFYFYFYMGKGTYVKLLTTNSHLSLTYLFGHFHCYIKFTRS